MCRKATAQRSIYIYIYIAGGVYVFGTAGFIHQHSCVWVSYSDMRRLRLRCILYRIWVWLTKYNVKCLGIFLCTRCIHTIHCQKGKDVAKRDRQYLYLYLCGLWCIYISIYVWWWWYITCIKWFLFLFSYKMRNVYIKK